jgi:hypothetical protein
MFNKYNLNILECNDIICLDLSSSISYKQKKSLIDLITINGFRVSFVLNKKSKILLRDEKTNISSYKCKAAFKLNIPVLHIKYIYDFISSGSCILNTKTVSNYLILNTENDKNFNNGLISFNKISK